MATVRWQAETLGRLLGAPVAPLVCVHGAHIQHGGLRAQGVAVVPASRLRRALGSDQVLSDGRRRAAGRHRPDAAAPCRLTPGRRSCSAWSASADASRVIGGPGSLIPRASIARNSRRRAVDQLGPNALGQVLEPGRVADCYLGLLLPPGPAGEPEAGTILIVAPAALLHPGFPSRPEAWSMSCSPATPSGRRASWCLWPI